MTCGEPVSTLKALEEGEGAGFQFEKASIGLITGSGMLLAFIILLIGFFLTEMQYVPFNA